MASATETILAGIRGHGYETVTATLDDIVARASPFTQHLYETSGMAVHAGTREVELVQPRPASRRHVTLLVGTDHGVDVPGYDGRRFSATCSPHTSLPAPCCVFGGPRPLCDVCRHPLPDGVAHACSFVATATALAADPCSWTRASPHHCRGLQRVQCEALAAALDAQDAASVRFTDAQWAALACARPGIYDALETPARKLFVPKRVSEPALVRVQYDAVPALQATLTTASADSAASTAFALVQIARAVARVDDVVADVDGFVFDDASGTLCFAAGTLHALVCQLTRQVAAALEHAPGVDRDGACFCLERLAWDMVFGGDRHAVLNLAENGCATMEMLRKLRAHELPMQYATRSYTDEYADPACDQALWSGFALVRSMGWPVSRDAVVRAFHVRADDDLPAGAAEVQAWVQQVPSTTIWLTPCELFRNFYSLVPPPYVSIVDSSLPIFLISVPNSSQGVNQMVVDGNVIVLA